LYNKKQVWNFKHTHTHTHTHTYMLYIILSKIMYKCTCFTNLYMSKIC